MKKSDNTSELFTALNKVCEEIKNPYNSADNPFYKSKYAPLDDTLNLVRPILAKNGLSFSQSPVSKEGAVGMLVGVEGLLTHSSGQWVEYEPFYFPLNKGTAQDAGSCITYARRYQLTAVFNIAGDNDDDANSASETKQYICSDCKQEIQPADKKTPVQIAIGTQKVTGKEMCVECFKKWQAMENIKKAANDV